MSSNNDSTGVLLEKGNTAYNKCDYNTSIEYYESGLKIAKDKGDKWYENVFIGGLGNAYSELGERKKAIEYYEKALTIAHEKGDKLSESNWLGGLGNAYTVLGEIKKAIEYYEKALTIAHEKGDKINKSNWLGGLGNAYRELGEIKKAIEYYEKALAIAHEKGDKINESVLLENIGSVYIDLGEIKKAEKYYEKALALVQEKGDKIREGIYTSAMGESNLIRGEWNSSLKLFHKALEISENIEHSPTQAEILSMIGKLQINSGDWDNARTNFNKSIEMYEKTIPFRISNVLVNLSELNISEESFDDAYTNLERAYDIVSKSGIEPKKINIEINFGRAYLKQYESKGIKENISNAKKYFESALKLAEKFERPLSQGIALRELGILYSRDNQKNKSIDDFNKSFAIFQKINARYELAKTYFDFARISAENNEFIKAEEMVKVCAFDCSNRNFKELEIDAYMLLGDIVWKQDNSQFGYYLEAFEKAIFNTRVYVKILFLLIKRMKRMDRKTTIEFINALNFINKEIQINSFFNSLLLKIQENEYNTEGLPEELIDELNNFEIS